MTVEELIKELEKLPKQTKVWADTIDEWGHYGGMTDDIKSFF